MNNMKSHYLWIIAVIAAFVVGGLLMGRNDITGLLPFALILMCPLMMIFMMKDHYKH